MAKAVYASPLGPSSQAGKKTVLSDRFVLGEELGRGAYGQVFKATDLTTGQPVAIKQISLGGMSADNLQSVMGEIDLLKTLNHKNIVQVGRTRERGAVYVCVGGGGGGERKGLALVGRGRG